MGRISGRPVQDYAENGTKQTTAPRLRIRRAELLDTSAAQALFAVRGQSDEATAIEDRGPNLGKPGRKMWLAFDGDRAVGMTSVQERQLRIFDKEHRIAYWTGLFIDPAYRSYFIYPQLVLAMFAGLRDMGIHHLYAAVRRQQIADAHLKIGLKKIGDMVVLAKPLQPALLFVKNKRIVRSGTGQRLLQALCSVLDAVAGMGFRLQGPRARASWQVTEIPWNSAEVADLARLYAQGSSGYTGQIWTVESLLARYAGKDSGYRLLGVRHQERLLAAAIIRVVDRPEGIRAAVIMDLIHEPDAIRAANIALAGTERLALTNGCEVVLFLDGLPPRDTRLVRRRVYLKSPEKYSLLMWTDRGTDPALFPQDLRSWRFAFGDHDTF